MKTKDKILSILFVNRVEATNKWWNRLVRVLIFGSTIVVAIFAITFFISNSKMWEKYSYYAFNFEENYSTTKGKEVNCFINFKPTGVTCGEYVEGKGSYEAKYAVDLSDFTKRYNKVIKDKIGQNTIDKLCIDGKVLQSERDKLGIQGLDPKMISCMKITLDITPIQIEDFPSKLNYQRLIYDEYLTSEQIGFIQSLLLDIKAKMTTETIYPVFIANLLYLILTVIGWFIFWESIVYRTLLYIIYGNKK